jgi:hypothetical protein
MKARSLVTVLVLITCAVALWGVLTQGHEISQLRIEKTRLETDSITVTPAATTVAVPSPSPEVPRELLQLRAEVARLSQRQRELAGARQENERLQRQLENRRTNSAARKGAEAAYIRASEAKWLGYNTPEDTLQSLFWAAQNRNLEKFLEAITPEAAEEFKSLFKESDNPAEAAKKLFDEENFPAGFRVIGREQAADGAVALTVQVVKPISDTEPGLSVDSSEPVRFEQIAGQWKMGKPH